MLEKNLEKKFEKNNIENTLEIFDAEAFSNSYSRRDETRNVEFSSRLVNSFENCTRRDEKGISIFSSRRDKKSSRQLETRQEVVSSRLVSSCGNTISNYYRKNS